MKILRYLLYSQSSILPVSDEVAPAMPKERETFFSGNNFKRIHARVNWIKVQIAKTLYFIGRRSAVRKLLKSDFMFFG